MVASMKAFCLLMLPVLASAVVDCSQYQSTHYFADAPISMDYVVTEDVFSARVVYEGQGYVSMAISANGRMRGALAMIGLPSSGTVEKYDMRGYRPEDVTPSNQQTLMDGDVQQNATHTVLAFKKFLKEEGEVELKTDAGYNYVLVAAGSSNELGYHAHKGSVGLRFDTCRQEEEEEETTQLATTYSAAVDCTHYQSTYSFPGLPLTMNYVVTQEGILSAQVVYEGQGYLALGHGPDGRMVDSMAIVGLPDANSVQRYFMSGYGFSSVKPLDASRQTLIESNIQQNDTHTVLEFSQYLQEEAEDDNTKSEEGLQLVADGVTTNFFLVAAGSSNNLGFHPFRGSVGLPLQVCVPGTAAIEADDLEVEAVQITVDNKRALFKAHGYVSALAWAFLAPLAVTSSLCRHLIPKAGLWYRIHFYSNVLVLLLTLLSLVLAYFAIQATEGGNHYKISDGAMGKHRTIGLVVLIVVLLQAMGGVVRPAGGSGSLRTLWEWTHKASGMALLAMGYYQCHSGLVLYAQRFVTENDYVNLFWAVAGLLTGVGVLGKLHKECTVAEEPPSKDEQDQDKESNEGLGVSKKDITESPTEHDASKRERSDSSKFFSKSFDKSDGTFNV